LPPEEAGAEKRVHLADRELQAALHAQGLAPLSPPAQYYVALGYYATCNADRVRIEAEKAAALNPYNAGILVVPMTIRRPLRFGFASAF
jgi:hypothetical protein